MPLIALRRAPGKHVPPSLFWRKAGAHRRTWTARKMSGRALLATPSTQPARTRRHSRQDFAFGGQGRTTSGMVSNSPHAHCIWGTLTRRLSRRYACSHLPRLSAAEAGNGMPVGGTPPGTQKGIRHLSAGQEETPLGTGGAALQPGQHFSVSKPCSALLPLPLQLPLKDARLGHILRAQVPQQQPFTS